VTNVKKYGHEVEHCKKKMEFLEWRPKPIQPRQAHSKQCQNDEWIQVGSTKDIPTTSEGQSTPVTPITNIFEVLQEIEDGRVSIPHG